MKKLVTLAAIIAALVVPAAGVAANHHFRTPVGCFRSYGWQASGSNSFGQASLNGAVVKWMHRDAWNTGAYFLLPRSHWNTVAEFSQVIVCLHPNLQVQTIG